MSPLTHHPVDPLSPCDEAGAWLLAAADPADDDEEEEGEDDDDDDEDEDEDEDEEEDDED